MTPVVGPREKTTILTLIWRRHTPEHIYLPTYIPFRCELTQHRMARR